MADSTELSGIHRPAGAHAGFELALLLLTILVLYYLSLDLTASDVVAGRSADHHARGGRRHHQHHAGVARRIRTRGAAAGNHR